MRATKASLTTFIEKKWKILYQRPGSCAFNRKNALFIGAKPKKK